MRATISLFLLAVLPSTLQAANCNPTQKQVADDQLAAITTDSARSNAIIARHHPLGVHVNSHASQGGTDNEQLLVQEGYTLSYDQDLRTALWVNYRLTKTDIDGASGQSRLNCFRSDPRITDGPKLSDYDEPIFDRGHMANDADMKDVLTEQLNTYMLTNMSPQYCRFNRGVWLSLEHLGRLWAKSYGEIYITSGAVFDFNQNDKRDKDKSAGRMGSRNEKGRVAIPSDYYKIFLKEEAGEWHTIAFLLEHNNEAHGTKWPDVFSYMNSNIVPLEDIEDVGEVALFTDIARGDIVQNDLTVWNLTKVTSNLEGGCR